MPRSPRTTGWRRLVVPAAGIAVVGVAALGCGGGQLGHPADAGLDRSTAEVGVPDAPSVPDASVFELAPPTITDGSSSHVDGPVLVVGPGAETAITSPLCDVWSRAPRDAGTEAGGGAAGWGRQFVDGASMAVSADGQGRIALFSRHAGEVDFGSGAVTAPEGQLCGLLSSFAADGAHRWSRGIAGAAYRGRVSSWPDGDIALLLTTVVVRFDSDGAVRWARRFDTEPGAITALIDGSLVLVTEWTQVVPEQAAKLMVTRLSPTGELLSEFSFNDDDRASFISVSPAGDIFLVQNVDNVAHYFSVSKVDADGHVFWSKTFAAAGVTKCLAAAATPQGGLVVSGWSGGDADFGGGPVLAGATTVSFAASFDREGRHLASRAFGESAYLSHSFAKPGGGVVIADNFAGTRTFDDTSLHTGSTGDRDFLLLDLDATLRVTRISRFGNGGGDQFLADLAPAPDGAVLIAGFFQMKLDLGWGVMRTAAPSDAFLARVTKDSPAPGVSTPSAGEPSLPADFTAPPPPQLSCDPAAAGTICDLPLSQCPVPNASDAGFRTEPNWVAYYENPRCVASRCVWDQRYFQCQGSWACMVGACASTTLAR